MIWIEDPLSFRNHHQHKPVYKPGRKRTQAKMWHKRTLILFYQFGAGYGFTGLKKKSREK